MKLSKGKKLLRDLKFYESYSKYKTEESRKESWEESVKDVMSMHRNKFGHLEKMSDLLNKIENDYKDGLILASQRNLQYREAQILAHNHRMFNCASTYIDRPEVFKQVMYVLLGGCGMGYSVEKRFVDKLPLLQKRNDHTITHVIEDSIEGWALALHALMMSFFEGSAQVRFDGSLIRPEGAFISGGFKAPGYEPLKKSLELIEKILQNKVNNNNFKLTSLDCHEIICISSDAVLSAGVRRSALICLFDKDDELMLKCKTGDWFYTKPWLARANNSVKLLKGHFTKEEFFTYKESIKEFGEPGVVLVDDIDFCTNPCCEIGFIPVNPKTGKSCISFCNLNEINGSLCKTKDIFYQACVSAAALGTLQASYTNFQFLGQDTIDLVEWEALIGVSITGIMDNPEILINPEILQEGAKIVKEVNKFVAEIIGINPAARTCCVKPSGNASVLLGTSSGIHPAHSKQYFRIMQINKNNEIGKLLKETNECLLEDSVWSAAKTDYAAYIPVEEPDGALFKEDVSDLRFLEIVNIVHNNWVVPGTNLDLGWSSRVTHNVSNTITVQDWDRVFEYIYENQNSFCGLSFMPASGDKVYKQAPFTKVMTFEELTTTYKEASIFASGLIVDSLHAFNNDLWDACEAVINPNFILSGDRYMVLLQKDIIRRIKQFSKNYFDKNLEITINCLKDVYLYHKWVSINRKFKKIDFSEVDLKPEYVSVNEMGALACNGNACEIIRI